MRKTITGLVLAGTLALAACSSDRSILIGGTSLTATVANPVTLDQQYEIEAAYALAVRSALAYTRLRQCRASEAASLTNPCARRSVKVQLQQADRNVRAVLVPFRQFMRNNQTFSAASIAGMVRAAIVDYQNILGSVGAL